MPNWCENKVTVTGEPDQVKHFYHANHAYVSGKRHDGEKWGECREFSFRGILPTPKAYERNGKWYDWNINNWGTKWDAFEPSSKHSKDFKFLGYSFKTAWSPPAEWIVKASKKFNLDMICYWHEEGGEAGQFRVKNGKTLYDEEREHPDAHEWEEEE